MSLKMDDINVFVILFSSKSALIASISCICNYKPFCNHLCDYKLFLRSVMEDSRKNCGFGQVTNAWVGMDKIPCNMF